MNDTALIDVAIINWNSGESLFDCVSAILENNCAGSKVRSILVVDNASCDGTAAIDNIQDARLKIFRNDRNLGFARGCNQAFEAASAPYILFLNPDVTLEAGSLDAGVKTLARDPSIGIVGIKLKADDGSVSRSCSRFPTALTFLGHSFGLDKIAPWLVRPHFMIEWDHLDVRQVDQVIGAFTLMRRQDFLRLGRFDERFFVYMEDVDLALRAHRQGLKSLYVSTCSAAHSGCGSTRAIPELRILYLLRSRLLYARKYFSPPAILISTIALLGIEPFMRSLRALAYADVGQARKLLRIWRWLLANHPYEAEAQRGEVSL